MTRMAARLRVGRKARKTPGNPAPGMAGGEIVDPGASCAESGRMHYAETQRDVRGVVAVLLALDPSINSTGWAKSGRNGTNPSAGVIRTGKGTVPERAGRLAEAVQVIAADVTLAVIEVPAAYSYARSSRAGRGVNQGSLAVLNRAIGAIHAALSLAGVPAVEVQVETWKGRRPKAWDQLAAKRVGVNHPDAADALGLLSWWMGGGSLVPDTAKKGDRHGSSR